MIIYNITNFIRLWCVQIRHDSCILGYMESKLCVIYLETPFIPCRSQLSYVPDIQDTCKSHQIYTDRCIQCDFHVYAIHNYLSSHLTRLSPCYVYLVAKIYVSRCIFLINSQFVITYVIIGNGGILNTELTLIF